MSKTTRSLLLAGALILINGALASKRAEAAEPPGWFDHCQWTCFVASGHCAEACGDSFGGCGGETCYGNSDCCAQS